MEIRALWGRVVASLATLSDGAVAKVIFDTKSRLRVIDDAAGTALADILAALNAIKGYVDGLEGFTDGLEGLLGDLKTYTDGLESLVTSSNSKLDTLHTDIATTLAGYVDQLEGYVDQLEGYVDQVEGKLDTLHTDIDTTLHGDLATTIKGVLDNTYTYLSTTLDGKIDTLDTVLDNIYTYLSTTMDGVLDNTYTYLSTTMDAVLDNIYTAVGTTIPAILRDTLNSLGAIANPWNVWSTEAGDFTATPNADPTNTITVSRTSLGGRTITLAQIARATLKIKDHSDSDTWKFVTLDKPVLTVGATTITIGISACTGFFALADDDEVSLKIPGPMRGGVSEDSIAVLETKPRTLAGVPEQTLISASQTITGSFADLGPEIPNFGENGLGFNATIDINDSRGVQFRFLVKTANGAVAEYEPQAKVLDTTVYPPLFKLHPATFQVANDADQSIYLYLETDNTMLWIQPQVKAVTAGATPGAITAASYVQGGNR